MEARNFPYEKFRDFYEKTQKRMRQFNSNELRELMVVQYPERGHYEEASHTKEASLASQLDMLADATKLHTDFTGAYLEPWHGVGVYAVAFGAKPVWYPGSALQTLCCYDSVEQVANVPYPDIKKCELLQMILESIRYFRDQTGDAIPIAMTDTQSPNDTASLILDACELFAASLEEPESIQDFMGKVTRLIEEFSDMQIDAIGEATVARSGHNMMCDPSFTGIALSDDNMAVISPESYRTSSRDFIERLSKHFGGVAVHSCGVSVHNMPQLLTVEGFHTFECAVGYGDPECPTDPNPNDAASLLPFFADRDITLKVRVGPKEIERVYPLLTPRVKLIVDLVTYGTIDDRNRQYDEAKEKMLLHYGK